jgi:hypothetical protein
MRRGPDAATLVERALVANAAVAGVMLAVLSVKSVRWESATFAGMRHRLDVSGDGVEPAAWLAALPEAEFELRGHLVADAVVVRSARLGGSFEATLELLTVEEG